MPNIQYNFNRFATTYNKYAVIQKEIAFRVFSRLSSINKSADFVVDIGSGTGFLSDNLVKKYQLNKIISIDFAVNLLKQNKVINKICADCYNLPIKDNAIDIIISNLMMQWCDVENIINESCRALKNNGLLMFSTFGPETLIELKKSWAKVDDNPHVTKFIDMHDIGDIAMNIGLSGVVVESEIITMTYNKVTDVIADIKNIGAQNHKPQPIAPAKFKKMINYYENYRINGKIPASYEVIYLHGWANKLKF